MYNKIFFKSFSNKLILENQVKKVRFFQVFSIEKKIGVFKIRNSRKKNNIIV